MTAAHENNALAACPFCGKIPDARDFRDVLYPSETYWRESEHGRQYVGHRDRLDGDQQCWKLLCQVTHGGCGAQVSADSRDEVIHRWNKRASRLQGQPATPRLPNAVHLGTMHSTIGAGRMPSETKIYGYTEEQMLEFARATLAAGSQAVQVPGWRPIETAPKDGAAIWAFNGEQGRMTWTEGDGWSLWVWEDDLLSDVDPNPDQPTHWMPLPAAPLQPLAGGEVQA